MKPIFIFLLVNYIIVQTALAQFPPAAGQIGTTAIHKDSSIFKGWATNCIVTRGYQNIANPSLGLASAGNAEMATGKSGEGGTVSLGDGGTAILTFAVPIVNGPGWDFAVFENSFDDFFLELAFVEVSSDGENFFRFPATSLTDTNEQIGTFDMLDATKINNLAGKYRLFHGTPFDLEEMANIPGLDVNNITHVKIIDVVGSLDNGYAMRDAQNNKINDPWPTPFPSGGFDLDAVGVINQKAPSFIPGHAGNFSGLRIVPNPAREHLTVMFRVNGQNKISITLGDFSGKQKMTVAEGQYSPGDYAVYLDISALQSGMYVLYFNDGSNVEQRKILKF